MRLIQHTRNGVLNYSQSVSHSGHPWPRNLWSGGEVSKYENTRDRRGESSEKQTCILQPEYDGGHDPRAGMFPHERRQAGIHIDLHSSTIHAIRMMNTTSCGYVIRSFIETICVLYLSCSHLTSTS